MPTLQIIVGTYEKVLHGLTATISDNDHDIYFADTFLFLAHGSAVRSLAISPVASSSSASERQRVILASGGSDERINLYQLSTSYSELQTRPATSTPSLLNKNVAENPRNRELGSLQHHGSSVNALYFPTRSKLLSAADDNTIAVTRTRDWTVLSSIKAPIPKAHGRPSGDTAPFGAAPAGVNDFAVHPSMKLMVSVGKGEKCMRLWNLVTGKKAGVLNFEKDMLQGVGEGRWGSGEGRKVRWNSIGEEFVVAFERGAVLFGLDSKPKARIVPHPPTKIHQIHYADIAGEQEIGPELLAVSTEDGRILFYSTRSISWADKSVPSNNSSIPILHALGELGGALDGRTSRIKDFEILSTSDMRRTTRSPVVVSGSSDGTIRVWMLAQHSLSTGGRNPKDCAGRDLQSTASNGIKRKKTVEDPAPIASIGHLLGTYETGHRITCLKAFVMSDLTADDGEGTG